MKKMIFSAIALVAFTATSMANDIKEKKVLKAGEKTEKPVSKKTVEIKVKKKETHNRNCKLEQTMFYFDAISDGFNNQDATWMSYDFYFYCMETKFQ